MTEGERFMAIVLEDARRALAEGNRPIRAAVGREECVKLHGG